MNTAAVIAWSVGISVAAMLYFKGNRPNNREQDFLHQGTIMQEFCRTGVDSLKFRDQLVRVDLAFRMAKPEIQRKSDDRRSLFETALSRWHCARTLLDMEDRGEEVIIPEDFSDWSRLLGKDTFHGRADGFTTGELASIAMEKGRKDFQTAEDCTDPKTERERVDAEMR
jgi:hypothetical protein